MKWGKYFIDLLNNAWLEDEKSFAEEKLDRRVDVDEEVSPTVEEIQEEIPKLMNYRPVGENDTEEDIEEH